MKNTIGKILAEKVPMIPAKHLLLHCRHLDGIMTHNDYLGHSSLGRGLPHVSLDSIYLYVPLHTLNSTGEKL
jgi:hypothetical protein